MSETSELLLILVVVVLSYALGYFRGYAENLNR